MINENRTLSTRSRIIELLQLFQSEKEQVSYEAKVPHVDITIELSCMWFDDQYHPNNSLFISFFTAEELSVLEEFNSFYKNRIGKLPPSQGTIRGWLSSSVWREIMEKAKETLYFLEPKALKKQNE